VKVSPEGPGAVVWALQALPNRYVTVSDLDTVLQYKSEYVVFVMVSVPDEAEVGRLTDVMAYEYKGAWVVALSARLHKPIVSEYCIAKLELYRLPLATPAAHAIVDAYMYLFT